MTCRRCFVCVFLLAAGLHAVAIARSFLPAQDGLKLIKVARRFQSEYWPDVIRATDRHPLYPIFLTATEPLVATFMTPGPQTWRVAAQVASAVAAVLLLFPLYGLTRSLFDERIACLASLIYVLLPFPAEIGHETLSDSLALLGFLASFRLGELALRRGGWMASAGCGIAAGLGYLTRPEVLVVLLAVLVTGAISIVRRPRAPLPRFSLARLAALSVAFLAIAGGYALVKGEVSEKLAVRRSIQIAAAPRSPAVPQAAQKSPQGLDDPAWDFSPKEESEEAQTRSIWSASERVFVCWAEGLGYVFVFFVVWGVVRDRFIRRLIARSPTKEHETEEPKSDHWARAANIDVARRLVVVFCVLFVAILIRHATILGYLSGRHVLSLVVLSIPWAAAGVFICSRGIAVKLGWNRRRSQVVAAITLGAAIATGVTLQMRPNHPTRWGHWRAGRWLATHTKLTDEVLDTRGWASFISQVPSYDYWHVRQALSDRRLTYIVVGEDELRAPSRRAATLRTILAYAATPVASFPACKDGHEIGVRVYRYHYPGSWEGLHP